MKNNSDNKVSDEVQKLQIDRLKSENAQLSMDLVNAKRDAELAKTSEIKNANSLSKARGSNFA